MSYSAEINFKTVREGELYGFLKQIKDACKAKFDEIAEDDFIFMPSTKNSHLLKEDSEYAKDQIDRAWMRNSIFSYRFFYIPEHNLLGVFGVPNAVKDMFDLNCYFQNSCDQDYDFEEWKGVPCFELIAEKWKNATDGEVIEHYRKDYNCDYDEDDDADLDYYRRTFAYDEIWEMCETYLYNEEDVVYISMFGGYELAEQIRFCEKCRDAYDKWHKGYERKEQT